MAVCATISVIKRVISPLEERLPGVAQEVVQSTAMCYLGSGCDGAAERST
jgi:hypothetical protein